MKKTFKYLFLLLLLQACHCKEKEKQRISITAQDREFIPYQSGETLHFIHSNGQNITFEVDDVFITEDRQTSGPECICCDYTTFETLHAILQSGNPYYKISIEKRANNDDLDELDYMNLKINNYEFFRDFSTVDYQDITISNTTYHDVYVFENTYNNMSIIAPFKVYYNKTYGILQIVFTNNENITLQP